MAKTLTESTTFDANISVPTAGDPRRAYSLEPAFQKLTNRTAYLKNAQDTQWVTGAADPEGSVSADPGTHYLATGEADGSGEIHIKLTGTSSSGWSRVPRYLAPDTLSLFDYTSGSDETLSLDLKKVTITGRNYGTIGIDPNAATNGSRIYLYGDDDSLAPSQLRLYPANSLGLYYLLTESAFLASHVSGADPDFGSTSKRWKDGYFSGDLDCTGGLSAGGTVSCSAVVTSGNATVGGTLSADAALIDSSIQAASAELGLLTMTGAIDSDTGSSIPGKHYNMPDANASVNWSTANIIYIASISSTRTLTLQTAGVPDGAIYRVYVRRGVVTSTGVNITHRDGVAAMRNSSGGFVWADFEVQDGFLQLMGGEYVA